MTFIDENNIQQSFAWVQDARALVPLTSFEPVAVLAEARQGFISH
jgi:hypothetical protein